MFVDWWIFPIIYRCLWLFIGDCEVCEVTWYSYIQYYPVTNLNVDPATVFFMLPKHVPFSIFEKQHSGSQKWHITSMISMGQSLAFLSLVPYGHGYMVSRIAATAPQESRRWAAVLSCGQSAKYATKPSKHPTSSTSVLADVDF